MTRGHNRGKLVQTKTGKMGVVYDRDLPFDDPAGRVPVHLTDGHFELLDPPQRLLCQPAGLTFVGFQD